MPEIKLTQGFVARVSERGFLLALPFKWRALKVGQRVYAVRSGPRSAKGRETILLHRVLVNAPKYLETDHIDGNTLNNHEDNLRIVTVSENQQGFQRKRSGASSKFRGVSRHGTKWQAYIKLNGRAIYLGLFNSQESAARTRDKAAKKYFGEFASINF